MSRPSDICVVLCSFPGAHEDGWIDADQIAGRLARLGFERPRAQQVAAWLRRLSKMDGPPIEMRDRWGIWEYRVSRFGETWVHNKLPDIWWAQATSRDRLRRGIAA